MTHLQFPVVLPATPSLRGPDMARMDTRPFGVRLISIINCGYGSRGESALLELHLPFPPSTNTYWRHGNGHHYLSNSGRRYRELVAASFQRQSGAKQYGHLALFAVLWPKDKRKRDLDNHGGKALLDALQFAGAFDDDCQIVALSTRWEMDNGEIIRHPEGLIHVRIVQAGG